MPPIRPLVTALALGLLAGGCTTPPAPRYDSPALPAEPARRVATTSLELREAQMPVYARGEEIWHQTADGALRATPGALWSDEPARALTRDLARELSTLSTALAVAEPWPFDTPPEARLDLRLERFHATAEGGFVLAGRYFLTPGRGGADRVGRFDIATAPGATGAGPAAIAAARAEALRRLARQIIAQDL